LVDDLRPEFSPRGDISEIPGDEADLDVPFDGLPSAGLNVIDAWAPNAGGLLLGELEEDPTQNGHGGI
jgi:hypothetical protein